MEETRVKEKQEVAKEQEESYKSGSVQYIDSREVAEMVRKNHRDLLRDIRRYCRQMEEINQRNSALIDSNQRNLALSEFFMESTYVDGKGERRACYLVTKKGCEFIAHKLTGIKGTEFTARYINRFHEMEDTLEVGSGQGMTKEIEIRILQFMEQQAEINKTMLEFIQTFSKEPGKLLTTGESNNPFNPGKSVLKERMDTLNTLVDQTAELCGLERNKLLHYMYQTMQEDMDINLKSYLKVYQTEVNNDSISIFHMICSIDKLYEKAVEMNNDVIERKKVYG